MTLLCGKIIDQLVDMDMDRTSSTAIISLHMDLQLIRQATISQAVAS